MLDRAVDLGPLSFHMSVRSLHVLVRQPPALNYTLHSPTLNHTSLPCLHYNALITAIHWTEFICPELHSHVLDWTTMPVQYTAMSLHYLLLHYLELHCHVLLCSTIHCKTQLCNTLPPTTLHFTTLACTTLHLTILNYIFYTAQHWKAPPTVQ